MPQGLIHVHGEVEQIRQVRERMMLVSDGTTAFLEGSPPPYENFIPQVVTQMHAYGDARGRDGLILDVGNVTRSLEGHAGAEEALTTLREHAIARIKPTCLLMETHSMYDQFRRVADVVLYADPGKFGDPESKFWVTEKGPFNEGLRFDPLRGAIVGGAVATPRPSVSAGRVITALRKDPALAWNVARSLRILGPWQRSVSGGWERLTPEGVCGAMTGVTVADDRQEHVFFRHDGEEHRVPLTSRTTDEVLVEADGILRNADFLLWDKVKT